MKTAITVNIDEKGDLHLDFAGYANRACEYEEAELRRILAEMGLGITVKGAKPKAGSATTQEQITPGTRDSVRL